LSPLKNAQDVLFTCAFPQPQDCCEENTGTHILLDGVQDPGNVGTVIRTADAFAINSVLLLGDCADIYNPKTVRASMGAVFRQVVRRASLSDIAGMRERGIRLIGTGANDQLPCVSKVDMSAAVIAIGNEGRGLSLEVESICDEMATIPMAPHSQSLNAAVSAAIIMWEVNRCLH